MKIIEVNQERGSTGDAGHEDTSVAARLLSAHAVRERCQQVLATAANLENFTVDLGRLDAAADYVVETIAKNYPSQDIPFHARWRHFVFDGVDRWQVIAQGLQVDREEMARIRFDLAVTSVLLDAGAGNVWRYRDAQSGNEYGRSEGLAWASLDSFASGLFSSSEGTKFAADAAALEAITVERLAQAFQVGPDNPLAGLEGRAQLMVALGRTVRETPGMFGAEQPRIGNLVDWIADNLGREFRAGELLQVVLRAFGGIWPGRLNIDGVGLGDTWHHPAVTAPDRTNGLVPFHKLSQWLTYSLIEPLSDAGFRVTDLDDLTGLAEYRNGGLFVDLGVIAPRDASVLERSHAPGDPLIVEWRALTVALLDRLAPIVRYKLERTVADLPLASILEGGTWSAGRRIASTLRPDGRPPIQIISDGSVF